MNVILNVLLGISLFSCNEKIQERSDDNPKKDVVTVSIPEEVISNENKDTLETSIKTYEVKEVNSPSHNKTEEKKPVVAPIPEHSIWGDLLKRFVDDSGNVDYAGFKKDIGELDEYLELLAKNPPTNHWAKNDKLAYYINLYNAATVKLIVDHYPLKSIKDIPNRWKKKWIKVGNEVTSLNNIEHEILRKMKEPRIHFAINCASYSCPKLLNVAFTPQSMERLLSKTTVDFVNDKSRNRFDNEKAQLSKIFKWYKGDFTENVPLLEYINQYLENPVSKKAKVEYLDYDWSLNEAR
ncbi:DUF547 domain-containing protein [Flagellimonas onchidii]|uniref:DUF547 domain-containing protein n=1 Tax=Flagellimonas onchidii TaxID=2562684 RepID=UPI0010A5F1FF|nr:DUF547 domain-containing protein [Allomuricauda onchidii]